MLFSVVTAELVHVVWPESSLILFLAMPPDNTMRL